MGVILRGFDKFNGATSLMVVNLTRNSLNSHAFN